DFHVTGVQTCALPIFLPGADPEIARQVAQRMLAALAGVDHDPESGGVWVTASIGVATYTPRRRFPSVLSLLEAADHALYAAKLRSEERRVGKECRSRW